MNEERRKNKVVEKMVRRGVVLDGKLIGALGLNERMQRRFLAKAKAIFPAPLTGVRCTTT